MALLVDTLAAIAGWLLALPTGAPKLEVAGDTAVDITEASQQPGLFLFTYMVGLSVALAARWPR